MHIVPVGALCCACRIEFRQNLGRYFLDLSSTYHPLIKTRVYPYSHIFQNYYDLPQLPRDGWPQNITKLHYKFSPPSTYDQKRETIAIVEKYVMAMAHIM